jgi:hypothetical protein
MLKHIAHLLRDETGVIYIPVFGSDKIIINATTALGEAMLWFTLFEHGLTN